MNYYDKVKSLIKSKKLKEAINYCEAELKKFPATDFHKVLNKNMLDLEGDLFDFIDANFQDEKKLFKTKAFYSELNAFSVNWDKWFLEITAFDVIEDFQDEKSDWLADGFWGSYDPEYFTIKGWEGLQKTFRAYHENEQYNDKKLSQVAELTEFLIVLRLQELFDKAIKQGKELRLQWAELPWGITAHEYSLIYEIRPAE